MKISKLILFAALTTTFSVMAGPGITNTTSVTNDLINVRVRAICISTNQSGSLSNQFFGNTNLIQHCATEMGISNLTGLRLVYDRTNSSLEVVSGTNQTFVCTALSFEHGIFITNASNTTIQGLSFIFVGTNATSSGTLSTTERITYGATNQITSLSIVGRFQYALPASGTNAATIYRGTFVAGSPLILQSVRSGDDEEGENEDHDEDRGQGGNHGHSKKHHGSGDHDED